MTSWFRPLESLVGLTLGSALHGAIDFEVLRVWWSGGASFIFVLAPAFVLLLDRRTFPRPKAQDSSCPPLPEPLREVVLLGRRYLVRWHCGKVLDQEAAFAEWQRGRSFVDQAGRLSPIEYQTVGEIPRKDALWVRVPKDGHRAWIFANASAHARSSDVVSGLGWIVPDGSTQFILILNHNTGQSEVLAGLAHANRARKFRAFIATTVCGAVVSHLASGFHTGTWTRPLAMAAVVSAIVVPLSAAAVTAIRNARFRRHYLPLFLEAFARLEVRR